MADRFQYFRRYFLEVDANLTLPAFIALLLGMVVISDLGLISAADGVLYAFSLAILLPSLTPYLLVAICTFQDVAGLSMLWWYGGTVMLGGLLVFRNLARGRLQKRIAPELFTLLVVALLVIGYAVTVSLLQEYLHGHPQSPDRPPLLVAGLMAGMMIAGVAATLEISRDGQSGKRLLWLVLILVANGLMVAFAKAMFGLGMFASGGGLEAVQEAAQLTEASALGIPRLIGTYLTPNGFALCYGLVMLLLLIRRAAVGERFIFGFAAIGAVLGVFSLSKAMMVFFLLAAIILLFHSRRAKQLFTVSGILALLLGAYLWNTSEWEAILAAFRVPMGDDGDLGYREQAWQLVTREFNGFDWLFGTGLSYWGVLFEENLGFSLSDPHTFLLSIPGTYGVLGVVYYVLIGLTLAKVARHESGSRNALALILLVLIFIKDAASIPYLIGNTPLTLLIWMLMTGAVMDTEANRR